MNAERLLAEFEQPPGRVVIRSEMEVYELPDRVSSNAIDVAGSFARLNVSNGGVGVCGGNRSHQLLASVSGEQQPVRFVAAQRIDEARQEYAQRLRHREVVVTFQRHENLVADFVSAVADLVYEHSMGRKEQHVRRTDRVVDSLLTAEIDDRPDVAPLTAGAVEEKDLHDARGPANLR